jgi:thiamine phosphate synthase YjbQ (UPF0047 family)
VCLSSRLTDNQFWQKAVVAMASGRLDGFALLTRTFGTWEQIFYGEFDGRQR